MARKISEIFDSLNVVKSTFQELHAYVVDSKNPFSVQDTWETLLADITTQSKVAIWRLFMWLFATGSYIVETLFDQHKAAISEILAAKKPHTLRWYAEQSKLFQYGYAMIWQDDQYVYERIDEDAKIIKYAAASEKNGKVILKVAKLAGGKKVPLSNIEAAAFTQFWSKWKDAGVRLEIVSQAADILKINLTIIRDRLVLNGDNSLFRDASVFPVLDAITTYSGSLEFDGIIMLSKLVDAIQAAEGVVDVKINSAYHKPAGGTYQLVDMSVETASGYFELDPETIYSTLDDIIVSIE